MPALRIRAKAPNPRVFREHTRVVARGLAMAGAYATDKGAKVAKTRMRQKMQSAGLGKLGYAIRSKSALEKSKTPKSKSWGVLYTMGGDESRTAQALYAYGTGVSIRASKRRWLAFPTKRIPQRVNRKKVTPALYNNSSLVGSIGPLRFVPVSSRKAYLVVDNVRVSLKTGRARKGGRRGKTLRKKPLIVAFRLIRQTFRGRRFLPRAIMRAQQQKVPQYAAEYLGRSGGRAR